MSGSANSPQAIKAQNDAISQLVRSVGIEMKQSIYSGSIVPANGNSVNIPLRQVGLVKGFIVEVTLAMSNTGSSAATLTDFGPANALSNISFFDLDNYQRVNTTGWHMNMLNTAKEGRPFGSAFLSTADDGPVNYGNNLSVISASSTLAATNGTGTVKMMYWVPLAYSKNDLRGSLFMGVVNATAYLNLTVNPAPGATTGDNTLAIYSGTNTAVSITNATFNVYQVYIDQLPRYTSGPSKGAPILPPLDIATQYRMVNTSLTGISAAQDFPIPFSNFQDFLSLSLIYDQAGTRNAGTDINYFALAAANTLQFFKLDPFTQGLLQRLRIKTDFVKGSYMFDFRDAPISTTQTGNMQLLMNAITAAAGSTVMVGFESFAMVNSVLGAASLPAS